MFLKHFSVFQYSKRMRTSRIVGVTETSCHYDLGKNNRHKTEGGDGTDSTAAKGYDCAFCDKSTKIGTLVVLYI